MSRQKEDINRLFVINKPIGVSSNYFLRSIKKKYGVKKAGFSGTLDPFACGVLVCAFGGYTKLFNYFCNSIKKYRATLWLGVSSLSLDIENISSIKIVSALNEDVIIENLLNLKGDIAYTPPIFSAKKIDGKRAYDLARSGCEVRLKESIMSIFDIRFISYNHPFITFEVDVSKGTYVRSIGDILASRLGFSGVLSHLERLGEGRFYFDDEKSLDPLDYLDITSNDYIGSKSDIQDGKIINIELLSIKEDGVYLIKFDDFFSIIQIDNKSVSYLLNKIKLQ